MGWPPLWQEIKLAGKLNDAPGEKTASQLIQEAS